jgi:antitoxin component YwqK of YwqJK toxin-antitoxin module
MNNTSIFRIIIIYFFVLYGCNTTSNKSETNETSIPSDSKVFKASGDSSPKKLTIDEINENILNTYIDRIFEIEKEHDNPIRYHENGLISDMFLCTKATNDLKCLYKGLRHRKHVSFYKNGKLRDLTERKEDEYYGEQLAYWENGQLQHKVFYQFGKKQGEEITYMMDGNINYKINYKNGVRDGESIFYLSPGKLKEKTEFRNGISIGDSFRYYESGKVEESCNDGNDFRYCKNYYENGKISLERKFNLITGNIISRVGFDEDGEIIFKDFYDENGNMIIDNSIIENFN